jgi:hypothetical protein
MTTDNRSKINLLLSSLPQGSVVLSSWLKKQGYSLDLQKAYRKSGWLSSIGSGAMIRYGDSVGYEGGVYALQSQADMCVHIGGHSAFSLMGKAHYLEFSGRPVHLFGGAKELLPAWFKKYNWQVGIHYTQTSFLPADLGLIDFEIKSFTIKISSPTRALMECLLLAPDKFELIECYQLMETINNVNPESVQALLEKCSSVKVKRLFLFLAEKADHAWLSELNLNKIDLGHGKRSLVKNGVYIPKYLITVPKVVAAPQ